MEMSVCDIQCLWNLLHTDPAFKSANNRENERKLWWTCIHPSSFCLTHVKLLESSCSTQSSESHWWLSHSHQWEIYWFIVSVFGLWRKPEYLEETHSLNWDLNLAKRTNHSSTVPDIFLSISNIFSSSLFHRWKFRRQGRSCCLDSTSVSNFTFIRPERWGLRVSSRICSELLSSLVILFRLQLDHAMSFQLFPVRGTCVGDCSWLTAAARSSTNRLLMTGMFPGCRLLHWSLSVSLSAVKCSVY